tara:strand:+ start:241 stop:642 length:402 start_codon:yes stop_codon:yes gene_type:complete
MATNPFANLGLGYMGAETGIGDKIGEAIKAMGTAYLLNASGLQGIMDKKKTEIGGAVPGAAVPSTPAPVTSASAPVVQAPMTRSLGGPSPIGAVPAPVNNPNILTNSLPPLGTIPLATDDDGINVLRGGMVTQ